MKLKSMVPVICATFAIAGVSAADAKPKKHKRNSDRPVAASVGVTGGSAEAGRRGARADAVSAGGAMTTSRDRCATVPNTSATYATGATYADRRTASAAGSTGGTASGSGTVNSSSTLEAGATGGDRTMAADAYVAGSSDAQARESTRRPAGC
jgi:hypothetical protein